MGERNSSGGAWGSREETSWWPSNNSEIPQQQISEEIARSTAPTVQQLFTYKVAGGFSNNSTTTSAETSPSFEYRSTSASVSRSGQSGTQQWWYSAASPDSNQQSPSPTEQSSAQPQNAQSSVNRQQNPLTLQRQERSLQQQQQQQSLQQTLQQSQQQVLQQALQQQAQQHQSIQDHIQAVQQQHIQAALKQEQTSLQDLLQQGQQEALLQQRTLLAQANARGMPRGRAADCKPRGRMTAYAFFVQTCREEHKKKHPEENVIFAEFSKKCAERWSTMVDKEKQRFHEMAEQDKKRYDLEMQNYVPPKGEKIGRGRKRKQIKDPNAPKRSLSAFFWFCNDERGKVKAANPDYTMGDIAKELGRRWAACDLQTKSKYDQLSEQDKARYDREMMAYKKRSNWSPITLPFGVAQAGALHPNLDDDDEYE